MVAFEFPSIVQFKIKSPGTGYETALNVAKVVHVLPPKNFPNLSQIKNLILNHQSLSFPAQHAKCTTAFAVTQQLGERVLIRNTFLSVYVYASFLAAS